MTPVAIADVVTQNIVSAMGVLKPQELATLMQPYGDQGMTFFQELVSLGFTKPVSGTTYYTTEEARFNDIFQVNVSAADPGAGNEQTLTVTTAYTENAKVYPRVGDLVFNPLVRVRAKIVDKQVSGANVTVTLRPLLTTENLGPAAAAATFVIYSSSFAEGTGQPESAIPKVLKYANNTQIIKETVGSTGTALTDELWFNAAENGAAIPQYFSLATIAAEYRQYKKIDGALLYGINNDNLGSDETTTEGIIPTAINSDGYLGAVTLDAAGFDSVDAYLRTAYAPNVMCAYLASTKYRQMENNLQTYFANANIDQVNRVMNDNNFGGSESLEALVSYQTLIKSGRVFQMKNLRSFDDPTTWNITGAPFQNYGLFFPMTKTVDGEGNLTTYLGVRYKALGAYSRMLETWYNGTAGPGMKIGDIDARQLYFRSDLGFHALKTQQWAMVI
jgi:hypothetical protein